MILPTTPQERLLEILINFLELEGIPVVETQISEETFLPGLKLKGNSILIDRTKLKYPGDLLHEAGHIAVSDPEVRHLIGTEALQDWPPDAEEMAAILWSYAASKHLGLDLRIVFHPDGYKDESAWLIEQFNQNNYIGLPYLAWMGLCTEQEFPKMKKWMR